MGFLTKFINKVGIKLPARFTQVFSPIYSGIQYYDDEYDTYIQKGYRQNDVVAHIVNDIASNVAKAKWKIRDIRTGKDVNNVAFEMLKKEAAPRKSLNQVLADGETQKMLTGNVYYVGQKGTGVNKNHFRTIFVAPSQGMGIKATLREIVGYRPNISTGFTAIIPASDVMHLKTINPTFNSNQTDEWHYGQPVFRPAKNAIRSYNDSVEAGLYFLQNKGAAKAIMLDENTYTSAEGENDMQEKLNGVVSGTKNNGNLPILGGVKGVIDLSADPKKALILEQRNKSAMEICSAAKYPAQLIPGLQSATYANAKEAKKALWDACVIPALMDIQHGLNLWLTPGYGENLEIYYDVEHIDALQDDKLMRGKALQSYAGAVTVNEWREMASLAPTTESWGEERYVGFIQSVDNNQTPSPDNKPKTG